jgi:hypothetical protein
MRIYSTVTLLVSPSFACLYDLNFWLAASLGRPARSPYRLQAQSLVMIAIWETVMSQPVLYVYLLNRNLTCLRLYCVI